MLLLQAMKPAYGEDEYYINGKRMPGPAKFKIERMRKLLEGRHSGFLGSVDFRAREAIAAAGVALGYEKAAKMIEQIERSPKVQKEKTQENRTASAMEKCRELAHETKTTEVREVSQFAWSYYNEELKQDQVTQAKTETMHQEIERKEEAPEIEGKGEDEGRRPMAMRVSRKEEEEERVRLEQKNVEERQARLVVRLAEKPRKKEVQKPEEAVRGKLEEAQKIAEKNKPSETEIGRLEEKAREAMESKERRARVRESEKIIELEAKHAANEAEKKENVSQILEFAVEKKEAEKGKGSMKEEAPLLQIDEKRLAAAEEEMRIRVQETKEKIAALGGTKKMGADERMKKEKSAKMRALRKKLAFWQKAQGALRRLGGGFFGGVAKMVGGIFK